MTYKIKIEEDVVGEIGEAIQHENHSLSSESYHYNKGVILEVAEFDTRSDHYHIFTDLDSGHRFKIHPTQYSCVG